MIGLRIIQADNSTLLPRGTIGALRGSCVVWIGKLGDPIEDIDADGLLLSPDDYQELQQKIGKQSNALGLIELIDQLNRLKP